MPTRGSVRNRNPRRRRDLSPQRILVLFTGFFDLVLSCSIACETLPKVEPVRTVKPRNFGETVMMVASEVYLMLLTCKYAWAATVIVVTVIFDYDEWGPSVLLSAFVIDIVVLLALIFTLVPTYLNMEGIDIHMLKIYLSFISMQFFYPTWMCMIPGILDLFSV